MMKEKKWLKVLLWIFFLPIMLIIYICKNEKMNKKTKGAWICAILLFSMVISSINEVTDDTATEVVNEGVLEQDNVEENDTDEQLVEENEELYSQEVVNLFKDNIVITDVINGSKNAVIGQSAYVEIDSSLVTEELILAWYHEVYAKGDYNFTMIAFSDNNTKGIYVGVYIEANVDIEYIEDEDIYLKGEASSDTTTYVIRSDGTLRKV